VFEAYLVWYFKILTFESNILNIKRKWLYKPEYYNIVDYKFVVFYGSEMWSLAPRVGHTDAESAWEQSIEENIWTYESGFNRRRVKIALEIFMICNLNLGLLEQLIQRYS
jgi:hypothetical protein